MLYSKLVLKKFLLVTCLFLFSLSSFNSFAKQIKDPEIKKANLKEKSFNMGRISPACKAAAKKKFEVWPSAYASGWGVRCTKAGGPGKMGKSKKKK